MHSRITLMDAHVHIHECFDVATLLDCAWSNFAAAAKSRGESAFCGVLLLTECEGVDWFSRLPAAGSEGAAGRWGRWQIGANDEQESVSAVSVEGDTLSVIRGRQIVSAEGLEVLGLGLAAGIRDGQPVRDLMCKIADQGAVCVLPWGFGKWTGQRGRIIRQLLDDTTDAAFYLGDNHGRLNAWPAPAEFRIAASRGVGILPGTDPLPLADQERDVGRLGAWFDRGIARSTPFHDVLELLASQAGDIPAFGKNSRLPKFAWNQLRMQLRRFTKSKQRAQSAA